MKHYSLIPRLIALLILSCMMFVPMVAAETTCSFINITQGPAGANGTSCTIAINATFTGAEGTDANVTNIGTANAAIFDFTLPVGPTGVYNASYLTSTYNSTYDAYTNYNASYITSTYNATYDAQSNYNASYITSTYNATYDAKLSNPIFGYVTLMAGSAMVTTTNPTVMNQWETTTNKNNYISLNFTDGGSEVAQWIVDFPADWNATANVIFTPVWTAAEGSGTANFTIKAKLFPDDAALDTALATVGTSVDTLITVGDVHVGPATTGAAISSVGTGGNTAIIQVSRDSSQDTLSGTAQLIGLRVKYVTNKA